MNFSDDSIFDESAAGIDITPLVDVVFLLLIFFMVSTTFVEARGIKVDLPAAAAKPAEGDAKTITLSIDAEGRIFFEEKELTVQTIGSELKAALERGAQATLVLRADKEAQHGLVVEVMDGARQAGIERIAVATVPSS